MSLLIFYLALAIGVSFLCSVLEAVLLSITPSFAAVLEKKNKKAGAILHSQKKDIDRPLSAILSLNTIAHTVGAAGVGAQAQIVFGSAYVGITSAILTLLILFLSEIIPKTIGAIYWKKLAVFTVRTIQILIFITYPLVILANGITQWLTPVENQPTLSREEFSAMAEKGFEEGVFEEGESNIFKNLIRFSSLKVKDVMTPRVVVIKFQENQTVKEVLGSVENLQFSRLPIYGKDDEDIRGYVLKTDLLLNLAEGKGERPIREIKRDLLMVPDLTSLKSLFDQFLKKQDHIAAVVDEYGGFAGLVTMEDVVETLLGMEIIDEIDTIEDMQHLARQNWKERAKKLGIVIPDDADKDSNKKKPE